MGVITHGRSKAPEYRVRSMMIQRCTNPKREAFKNYGARGISVCPRWLESFSAFYEDVGPRPTSSHTLERIDNNVGYEPGNVCWATRSEQNNNSSHNRWVEFNGKRQTMTQWSKEVGIPLETLRYRLDRAWPLSKAFNKEAGRG